MSSVPSGFIWPCLVCVLTFVCTSAGAAVRLPRGCVRHRGGGQQAAAAAKRGHQKAAEQRRQQILHLKRSGPEKDNKMGESAKDFVVTFKGETLNNDFRAFHPLWKTDVAADSNHLSIQLIKYL